MRFNIHQNGCFIQLHKCNFMLGCCWLTHRHFEAPPPLVPPSLTVPQISISSCCLSHISRPEIWTMSYWVERPSNSLQVPGWLHPDMVSSPLRCALPGWPTTLVEDDLFCNLNKRSRPATVPHLLLPSLLSFNECLRNELSRWYIMIYRRRFWFDSNNPLIQFWTN